MSSDLLKMRLLSSLAWLAVVVPVRADVPQTVDYNSEVKPIFSDRCYKCHGPDAQQRQADFRLDVPEGPHGALEREVIRPGNPEASDLFKRITSTDPDVRMPPVDSKLPSLTSEDIAKIRRWIAQGATWMAHWSFIPLTETPVPSVRDQKWARNPIDYFVLSTLEAENIAPASEATKETLLRRVSFDLTGLPPTLDQIDAFLDDDSPDAFERVVDRLLESDRYGEQLAIHWLDVSRYADSYGYQVDKARRVWPWRDWVIRAFNENLPYDQFLTWQLAGDLLPSATDDQILATAFNRLHPQKSEGGSIEEEFRIEYVADRTHTFGTAFLGLTVECARCHEHKYDPIPQKDYYQLFAFFNNIDECGLYSYHNWDTSIPTPTLLLTDMDMKQKIASANSAVRAAQTRLDAVRESRREAFEVWLDQRLSTDVPVIPGLVADFPFDGVDGGKLSNVVDPEAPGSTSVGNMIVPGRFGNALRLTGDDVVSAKTGDFTRNDPFSFCLWINSPNEKQRAVVVHRTHSSTDSGSRGYQLLIERGMLSASLIHFWPGNAIQVRTNRSIPTGQWLHVGVTYDGSSEARGLHVYVDGQQEDCQVVRDNLFKLITDPKVDQFSLGARTRDLGFTGGLVDQFQIFSRELTKIEVAQLSDGRSLTDTLSRSSQERSSDERQRLFEYYLANTDEPYAQQLARLRDLRVSRGRIFDDVPEIMVMQEMTDVRPTYLLERGAYDAPRQPVEPLTPRVLIPFPAKQPRNRLGLATWLTHPQHPLTARVSVNRFWQLCFGDGLVRTPEDFGSQGELPTHPKLLDWLAKDFIDSGWDTKRLMKKIVMSATYRQSSHPRPEIETSDPNNRRLAHGPRQRLSAEMIRDNALAVSGLLVEQFGGPPTRPYEVAASFHPREREKGIGLYRRSLYTQWRRTGPPPMMIALDAAKRDICVVKREQTLTPLQPLVLLNSPQMVEASRVLGERLIVKYGSEKQELVNEMFRILTSRRPSLDEGAVLLTMFNQQFVEFSTNPERAKKFLAVGDTPCSESLDAAQVAAAGAVASALLSLDACIMKR